MCIVEYRQVPFDGFGSVEEVVTPFPGYKNLIYHKLSKPDLSQIEVRGEVMVMFTNGLSLLNIF